MNEVQTPDVRGTVHDDAASLYLMDHPTTVPTLHIGRRLTF